MDADDYLGLFLTLEHDDICAEIDHPSLCCCHSLQLLPVVHNIYHFPHRHPSQSRVAHECLGVLDQLRTKNDLLDSGFRTAWCRHCFSSSKGAIHSKVSQSSSMQPDYWLHKLTGDMIHAGVVLRTRRGLPCRLSETIYKNMHDIVEMVLGYGRQYIPDLHCTRRLWPTFMVQEIQIGTETSSAARG